MRHRHWIVRFVSNPAFAGFGINFDDKIEVVMLRRPFTKLQHFGELITRIDMQDRERNFPEKGFAGEPEENVGILPHRPWHGDVFKGVIRLSKNENALVLELVEMSAAQFGHDMLLLETITKLATDEHRFTQIHVSELSVFFP